MFKRSGVFLLATVLLGVVMIGILPSILPSDSAVIAQSESSGDDFITYYADVQPILAGNCMGCHVEGGIGPFSMEDPAVVQEAGRFIVEAVQTGVMPPWMPGEESPAFKDERSLTQDEIDTIAAWYADDMPLGDPADVVEMAVEIPQVRADLTLQMPVAYTADSSLTDDYRCFLLDPQLTTDRYITGYTVQPGAKQLVHHVLLYQISADARSEAEALDSADSQPGWQCFGGAGIQRGTDSGTGVAGSVGSWTPGSLPIFHPEGTGGLLQANSLIVMQVHYNLHEQPVPDQTTAVFQLEDEGADIIALRGMSLVAPVVIPCAPDATSPDCDLETAIRNEVAEDGQRALRRNVGLLGLCGRNQEDYVDQDAAQVASSCDFTVREDSLAVAVAAHMHERGQTFIIERNPDGADAQILLYIPAWDFHWQGRYQYVEPILLNAGDTIRITCTWDNSDGDRFIFWGEGTADEMCLGGVTLQPVDEG